ncbi:MAG: restriction endonuclease subunit S [Turicibacter sp.]|nr:restriction endonuclease subunit S [Turicibacter sp.]
MSNYSLVKLKDLIINITDNRGKTPPLVESGIELIETPSLRGDNKYVDFSKINKYVSQETYETWFRSGHPKNGDILITLVGTIGKVCIFKDNRGCIAQNIVALEFNEYCNSEFMYYYLSSPIMQNQISFLNRQSAQPNLKVPDFINLAVSLPPLKEQQKIAEILSSVDAAIEKTEQVIAKTEEVKKGLMQQLLTQGIGHTEFKQTEIGEIPIDWEVKQMKELCNLLNGRAYKKSELLDCGKTPVLRVGNFFTNQNWYYSDLELEENKYCDNGDLLYAWSASFGPRIWDGGKVIYHYHIWKLELLGNINRDFMYYLLLNDVNRIKKSTTGSTMIHISKENMEPRLFAIPSLYEQQKIANILVNQDLMIKHEYLKLDRLNNLKKGLMQQLLTGQVRVKVD